MWTSYIFRLSRSGSSALARAIQSEVIEEKSIAVEGVNGSFLAFKRVHPIILATLWLIFTNETPFFILRTRSPTYLSQKVFQML